MLFGSTNAPALFQNLGNDIFSDFLDIFVAVYLYDIIVFSSSEEEQVKHVDSFLQRLRDNNSFAKASKYLFYASSVEYFGYVVSSEGLKMDSSKVQKILNWPQPKNMKVLQSFLGFANFYFCFLKNYSKKICALTFLLKKNSPFIFNEEALSQFQIRKAAFTTAPILYHFNPSLPTIVETDASDYALGAVLSRLATLPDALSRRDNMYPERGMDFIKKNPQNFPRVLKQNEIEESRFFSYLVDQIQKTVWQDKDYEEILKQLERDKPSGKLSTKLQSVHQVFKEELGSEIKRFKKYADRNREIPPYFQLGDKLWLASKNIKITRTTKKLPDKWLGHFEVLKKLGSHA
ncbi:hypothetical protein O181_020728 [Austropuccinia psidii MF-1]|uniref:Reverse transcriptase domain-containing protein n=1 Tax=Austropuccinia psidii MF-1 TaxID=1389203 RepID=A0A9Q3GUS5_9BASI|nr:hypothetical protein [Austropuccinia psidii MF-1]